MATEFSHRDIAKDEGRDLVESGEPEEAREA